MQKINAILKDVLKEIQPDKDYEKGIFARISTIIKKINTCRIAKAVLGGSGAKGTWLKAFDADIFVMFDYKKYKDKSDKLSDLLEVILKKRFKNVVRLHGSRDYFQIKEEYFTFEVVPILKIKKAEQSKNITDVSPLHASWVRRYKNLREGMRLTKHFCKSVNAYGAESYIRGFSGYVCEILTIYYGSFLNLIKYASKWDDKVVIDPAKYYKNKDVFKLVNTSKLNSPLIVIDPVQKDRNAAAALCYEKFEAFKKAAKGFLRNPSKKFFEEKNIFSEMKNNQDKNSLFVVQLKPLDGKIDVVGSKLLKIYETLIEEIKKNDFKLVKSDWEWNKGGGAYFYFLFDKSKISKFKMIRGPPLALKEHVARFKQIHKKTFTKSGHVFSKDKRKYYSPKDLFEKSVKSEFVTERCGSIKFREE